MRQTTGGTRGWRMRTLLPKPSGSLLRRSTLVTDCVHSAHLSTSIMTAQTFSTGAWMSTEDSLRNGGASLQCFDRLAGEAAVAGGFDAGEGGEAFAGVGGDAL